MTWRIVLILMIAAPARAQEQPPEVHALASALADEQARVAELKAELDRRSAALADLARRLELLAASATTVPPPSAERPSAPASAPSRFEFYGDSRVRIDALRQDFPGCVGCPDRQRARLRLRLGIQGRLSPDFAAGLGLSAGDVDDPNTVYATLGNNFSRKVATWDRGYVEYHPTKAPWMQLTAGKFPYTWVRSPMTFDVDFYPEGFSERFSFDLRHSGPLTGVGVQGFQLTANEQPADHDARIIGAQLTLELQPAARLSTRAAVTGIAIQRPEFILRALLDGSDVGVRNTNATILDNGVAAYASAFRYANVIVENTVRTPWEALPLTVGVEYQRNLRASSNRDTGLSLRLDAGRAERPGDWEFGWHIFRVEQDAILAALGESDWRAPSNVLQQRYAVNRMLNPNVQLSFTLYRGRTLDRALPGALFAPNLPAQLTDPWTNRVYLDVTYKY